MNELLNNFTTIIENNYTISLIIALIGGIIASFSPCTLTTFPLIIGYLNLDERSKNGKKIKYLNLKISILFSVGIAFTFTLIGVLSSIIGNSLRIWGNYWYLFLAIILLFVSLQILKVINLKEYCKVPVLRKDPISAFFLGIIGGIFASPCATPILITILSFIAQKGNIIYGISLMIAYSIGYSSIILLIGIFGDVFKNINDTQKYTKIVKIINYAFGMITLLISFYLFYIAF